MQYIFQPVLFTDPSRAAARIWRLPLRYLRAGWPLRVELRQASLSSLRKICIGIPRCSMWSRTQGGKPKSRPFIQERSNRPSEIRLRPPDNPKPRFLWRTLSFSMFLR